MGSPKIADTSAMDWRSQGDSGSEIATVRQGETTPAQVAERLGVSTDELLRANPQLADLDQLSAGMDVCVPAGSDKEASGTGIGSANAPQPSLPSISERRTDASVMKAFLNSSSGWGSTSSASPSGTRSGAGRPDAGPAIDPRFGAVNQALRSGNGAEAIAASQKLIDTLLDEKPPQPRILNQARMSLAAASLLQGNLDSASKALTSVDAVKLEGNDKEAFSQLSDLLKGARRDAFSNSFDAAVNDSEGRQDLARAAATNASKLADFLQATDSGNTAEIAEARLKQANALLVGNQHREAAQVLDHVNEKSLDPDQQEYLRALKSELHGQQVDALAHGFQGDMQRKQYKSAVSDATALASDLSKYFPEDKPRIISARVGQATAQIMDGDMEAAGKTLNQISPQDLQRVPQDVRDRYGKLRGAIAEHSENVKKIQEMEKEQTTLKSQLDTINDLATSGDKNSATKAVPMAEQLLAKVQQKYPDNEAAISGAKMTLANAKLGAGDVAGAKAELQKIAAETKDPAIKDEAQLLLSRAVMKEGHTEASLKILEGLSDHAATPEMRKAAKDIVVSVERDQMKMIGDKANLEAKNLRTILDEKRSGNIVGQFFSMPSRPISAMDQFETDQNRLDRTFDGSISATMLMKTKGLTLGELQNLSHADRLNLERGDAKATSDLELFLNNPDAKLIAGHHLDEGALSWQNNTLYADPSYLDSSLEKVGQWVGDRVRGARNYDDELKASDSAWKKVIGYGSAFILDRVSDANNFIKDKLKTASDFYNDPARKDTWYAKLGRAGTFGGDMLTSVFTMPATIVDYKATDKERTGAILGTVAMAATAGIIKGGGPAWRSATNLASRGTGRIASSEIGQWVANSEFGQMAGRGMEIVSRGAGKIGQGLSKVEGRFEETGFAQTMDRVKDGLGKLNPTIGGSNAPSVAAALPGATDGAGSVQTGRTNSVGAPTSDLGEEKVLITHGTDDASFKNMGGLGRGRIRVDHNVRGEHQDFSSGTYVAVGQDGVGIAEAAGNLRVRQRMVGPRQVMAWEVKLSDLGDVVDVRPKGKYAEAWNKYLDQPLAPGARMTIRDYIRTTGVEKRGEYFEGFLESIGKKDADAVIGPIGTPETSGAAAPYQGTQLVLRSQRAADRLNQIMAEASVPTTPSLPPDPARIPEGRPTPVDGDAETRRGLTRENDSARILSQNGYDIVQNPRGLHDISNPDYEIEGKIFDSYAPSANKSPRGIASYIKEEKLDKLQAHRVVLNLQDWAGDIAALKKQFTDWPIEGLDEILVIGKDGSVSRLL
jgi:predicted negative regulator of RcsB-dependent stress response